MQIDTPQSGNTNKISIVFVNEITASPQFQYSTLINLVRRVYNPSPMAFPYGNGMVLHFYQQQECSTTKTVHKFINKCLKKYVLSLQTGANFH